MTLQSWWHYRRARLYLFLNWRDRAIEAFRDVLKADPGDTLAASSLGYLYGEQGEYEPAIAQFEYVLQANPDDADTRFNLGFLRQKQSLHEDAIALFQSAVKLKPSIDRAWFGLGVSYAAQARHHEAIEAFEHAAKLQPMNPHALYELGLQHHALGEADAVTKTIGRLKQFDPKATAALIAATRPQAPQSGETENVPTGRNS